MCTVLILVTNCAACALMLRPSVWTNSFLHFCNILGCCDVGLPWSCPISFPAALNGASDATPPLLYLRRTHLNTRHAFTREFWLTDNPLHQGCEWQFLGPDWMDSASSMPVNNCVTLLQFAPMHSFCCTACGQLLVCHARGQMITCKWPYLLAAPQMGFSFAALIPY